MQFISHRGNQVKLVELDFWLFVIAGEGFDFTESIFNEGIEMVHFYSMREQTVKHVVELAYKKGNLV